jgi:tellurite resistance protein TerC
MAVSVLQPKADGEVSCSRSQSSFRSEDRGSGCDVHPERNPVLRLFRRIVPAVPDYRGPRFAVKDANRWCATPLLMVLVVAEATDIVFAVDSIPAVFAVTTDPFIVFTSNIFAILGLRSLWRT